MTEPVPVKNLLAGHDHGRLIRDGAVIVGLMIQFGVFIWQASRVVASVDNLNGTMREVRSDLKEVTDEMVTIKLDHARLEASLRQQGVQP